MSERVIRKVFPRDDGLVEDVLSLIVHNDSAVPLALGERDFHYTDVATIQHLALRQNVEWMPSWVRGSDGPGHVVYRVTPAGDSLAPNEYLCLAVKVLRGGCVTPTDEGVTFQDPIVDHGQDGGVTSLESTVVFPERQMRMEVAAPNALTTSRTATWLRGGSAVTSCLATHRRARLSGAPRQVDNAIAELHRLLAAVVCHEWLSLHDYSLLMNDVPSFTASIPSDEQFRAIAWPERIRWLESQIELCASIRSNVVARKVIIPVGTEQDLAEHASRAVAELKPDMAFVPVDLWEALESLSRYLLEQRRLPTSWPLKVKERHLHQDLQRFLSGRLHVESEVQSSRGRIDFLLGQTPVELKCRPLGKSPKIHPHLQQAAEYATSRGRNTACLVILDTTAPSDAHGPLPTADVTAHAVIPAPAIGAAPPTSVVVFVLRARSMSPSKLGKSALKT